MKARRKSDGEIIEVREWSGSSDVVYPEPDMNRFYQASDLDFNVDADAVTQGWVARDSNSDLFIYNDKPKRDTRWDNIGIWYGKYITELASNLFPDLTWDDEPQQVEIIIKRKKK